MPALPGWISRIDLIIQELGALPRPFVDRATLEHLLRVGRRRAQQILAPCVSDRELLIAHLRAIADGVDGQYERRRRSKVARYLEQLRTERTTQPHLLVEAPVA